MGVENGGYDGGMDGTTGCEGMLPPIPRGFGGALRIDRNGESS